MFMYDSLKCIPLTNESCELTLGSIRDPSRIYLPSNCGIYPGFIQDHCEQQYSLPASTWDRHTQKKSIDPCSDTRIHLGNSLGTIQHLHYLPSNSTIYLGSIQDHLNSKRPFLHPSGRPNIYMDTCGHTGIHLGNCLGTILQLRDLPSDSEVHLAI